MTYSASCNSDLGIDFISPTDFNLTISSSYGSANSFNTESVTITQELDETHFGYFEFEQTFNVNIYKCKTACAASCQYDFKTSSVTRCCGDSIEQSPLESCDGGPAGSPICDTSCNKIVTQVAVNTVDTKTVLKDKITGTSSWNSRTWK